MKPHTSPESIYKVANSQQTYRTGSLLVAEPALTQPYFDHSVIMLVDTDDNGALGAVLNYPIDGHLSQVLDGVDSEHDVRLYCGGPVGHDRLFYIHTLGPDVLPGAIEFGKGLYVGGDTAAVLEYVNSGYPIEGHIRFFVGYSGWRGKQLQGELAEGTWGVASLRTSPEKLLSIAPDRMWHTAVGWLDDRYRAWKMIPRDAINN